MPMIPLWIMTSSFSRFQVSGLTPYLANRPVACEGVSGFLHVEVVHPGGDAVLTVQ